MWITSLWNEPYYVCQWMVVCACAMVAAATDLRSRRIPNWLTFPMWFGGLALATFRYGVPGFADAFIGSMIVAAPYIALFIFAGGGAGDAKIMAGIGAWLGMVNGVIALACVSLFGVAVAMIYAYTAQRTPPTVATASCEDGEQLERPLSAPLAIPYGVPIFFGVAVSATGVLLWKS